MKLKSSYWVVGTRERVTHHCSCMEETFPSALCPTHFSLGGMCYLMDDAGKRNFVPLHRLSTFAFLRRHSFGKDVAIQLGRLNMLNLGVLANFSCWPRKSCSSNKSTSSKYIYKFDLQMFYPCAQFNWLWTQESESEGISSIHNELWGFCYCMSTNGADYFCYNLKVPLFPPQSHYYSLILSRWEKVVRAKFKVFCPEISNISNLN